uniref:Phospholipid scramblase n=1 Tax=Sinocyclocheilus grahami TaxID=75366 RepID=A0A672K8Q2_SINGR
LLDVFDPVNILDIQPMHVMFSDQVHKSTVTNAVLHDGKSANPPSPSQLKCSIVGPFCSYHVILFLSVDESSKVGRISKEWPGLLREAFTDADHLEISFPLDLDVKIKAALFGACFLIVNFMFFEQN